MNENKLKGLGIATEENPKNTRRFYRLTIEIDEEDIDKYMDFKYYLLQKYGSCGNKELLQEALNIVHQNTPDITPRPDSVKQREKIVFRQASKK